MGILKNLSVALFVTSSAPALAQDAETTYEDRDLKNITCTNDGNGAFSFHMEGYDEPMVQISNAFYSFDGNHLVHVNMHEDNSLTYANPIDADPNVKISKLFMDAFNSFSGRFLLFFEPDANGKMKCSIEEHFLTQKAVRRNFVEQGPKSPAEM